MSRWLLQNLSLLLLALILAFLFWAVATEAEDPTRRSTFNTPIPVEVQRLPEGKIAYGAESVRVWIDIQAPASVLSSLRAEDIEAYIDLANVITGTVEVPVQVDVAADPVVIANVRPSEIEIVVEDIAEKEVPVEIRIQGTPSSNFQMGEAEIAPQSIRVRGPASLVQHVVATYLTVNLADERADIRSDYEPVPVDEAGNPVDQVEVIPKTVTVSIPIRPLAYSREVVVDPALEGQPPSGYRVAGLAIEPPTLTIIGPTRTVESTTAIETEPISLNGLTQTVTTTAALRIPFGLTIIEPETPRVTVTLSVEVIRSGLTLEVTPQLVGLDENLEATVALDSVLIILSGPLSVMETLDPSDVQLTLDLTGKGSGEWNIEPEISVPEGVDIENIVPDQEAINVTITTVSAPSPSSRFQ